MLGWLRNAIQKSNQQVVTNGEKTTRRARQTARTRVGTAQQTNSNFFGGAASGAQGANAGQQPNRANDIQKYIRYGFLLMGASIFINNVFLDPNNPDSLINRALYPKGRGKFALKIEKWDEKIMNYRTAYNASTDGIQSAMRQRGRHRKLLMLDGQLDRLSPEQVEALLTAAKHFSKSMESNSKVLEEFREIQARIIRIAVERGLSTPSEAVPTSTDATQQTAESEDGKDETSETQEGLSIQIGDQIVTVPRFNQTKGGQQFRKTLHKYLDIRMQMELEFMTVIETILQSRPETKNMLDGNPDLLSKLKNSLLGLDSDKYDTIMEKLYKMSLLPSKKPPKVFVVTFKGDMMASQVARLREEITAILNICDVARGDRVVLQLNSGGGTVTGYGLAAAQLQRIRDAGLPLTVCIDEVAASGGYMMAAVADYIIASPFAVVGSVGVIATIPNFSERLQREGVVVEDVTAGKYKRTMTPYKKPNNEDRVKMKDDIEHVLVLFKAFLKQNRPRLNVDAIATGETWQGPDALRLGLVDELRTTDSYLSDLYNSGHEVLTVAIKAVAPRFSDVLEDEQHTQGGILGGLMQWAQSWVAQVLQGALEMTVKKGVSLVGGKGTLGDLDLDDYSNQWRVEDADDDLFIESRPKTFRERIMMISDQAKNPPMC